MDHYDRLLSCLQTHPDMSMDALQTWYEDTYNPDVTSRTVRRYARSAKKMASYIEKYDAPPSARIEAATTPYGREAWQHCRASEEASPLPDPNLFDGVDVDSRDVWSRSVDRRFFYLDAGWTPSMEEALEEARACDQDIRVRMIARHVKGSYLGIKNLFDAVYTIFGWHHIDLVEQTEHVTTRQIKKWLYGHHPIDPACAKELACLTDTHPVDWMIHSAPEKRDVLCRAYHHAPDVTHDDWAYHFACHIVRHA